ncbi:MAG: methylmalonyl-CoA epimerase [Dehalococcoidia bacterium]|nr:methylmalonyl-CoA epimerase [Dehalococcoidia bacterium]
MALVKGIAHLGIAVRDLDKALVFYRDALGLPIMKTADLREQGVRAALLRLGDSGIELLEPRAGSALERFLERRGEGLHHLALESEDIAGALAQLREKEAPLIDQEPRRGLNGLVAFVHPSALHGVLVEMEQPEHED